MIYINDFRDLDTRYRRVQKKKGIVGDAEFWVNNMEEFERSKEILYETEKNNLGIIDSNLCTVSHIDNNLLLVSNESFIANTSKQKINKAYYCLRNCLKIINRYYPCLLEPKQPKWHRYVNITPRESTIKFLYGLTMGNNDILTDFAKLCYFITKTPYSLNQPLIIYANKSLHKPLIDFIECLTERKNLNLPLKSLLRSNKLIELYTYGLNGNAVNITELGVLPTTEASIFKIKQVLIGDTIRIKNPQFSGKLYIKNRVPFVFITDNHRKYIKFKQMFGAFDVRFDPNATFDFEDKTIDWFRLVFTELGKKWFYSKNCRVLRSTDTKDEIIQAFVHDICKIKDGEICKKSVLYDAYCEYYQRYYAGEPLKMTSFGRAINIEKKFREFRKHISRQEYPWFYEGITISKIKYERFKKSEGIKYHCSYNSFKKYIFEWVDKEVIIPKSFDEVPYVDGEKLAYFQQIVSQLMFKKKMANTVIQNNDFNPKEAVDNTKGSASNEEKTAWTKNPEEELTPNIPILVPEENITNGETKKLPTIIRTDIW